MSADLSEHATANEGRRFLERAPDRRDSFSPVAGTHQRPHSGGHAKLCGRVLRVLRRTAGGSNCN